MTDQTAESGRLTDDERAMLRGLGQGQVAAVVERIIKARHETCRAIHLGVLAQAQREAWDAAHDDFCVVAGQMRCTLHENPYSFPPGSGGHS